MKCFSTFVSLLLSYSFAFAQHDTLQYSVVSNKKIKGILNSWQTGPGEYHYFYQYNDRGRGDSTFTQLSVNPEGLITSLNTNGVDYYKMPYTESFHVIGDSAVWSINGLREAKKFEGQLYNVNTDLPSEIELLIQKLEKQKDRKIEILPKGSYHCDAPKSITLSINGKNTPLKLYAIYSDPNPLPDYVWLTDDLHFFAQNNGWYCELPKGDEAWADSLYTLQEMASTAFYGQQLKENSVPLPRHIIFTHATLFHSSSASVEKDMTVELENARVIAIYPSAQKKSIRQEDSVVDCKGKFLMPGLWDMHCHYFKSLGVRYLAGGVTHIRDMGNSRIMLTYQKQISENQLLGPDITYLSGFIDKEGPLEGPTGAMVSSLDEALKAIDDYHRLGYQQIKIYSSMLPEWVAPMAAHAHQLGMRFCGHIPSFMTATQAIQAGYDEITHLNFVFLNFLGDTVDTRSIGRLRLPGIYAGKLDLQSKPVKDFVALMKQKKISLDATLGIWEQEYNTFKSDTFDWYKPIIKWVPESSLHYVVNSAPFGSEEDKPVYQASFQNMLKMMKLLYDNGILLVPGTDGGAAIALERELVLYGIAGIPANEVLKIATYNCAKDCNLLDKYGEIKIGRTADFILIDGDPTINLNDIRNVEWVIKKDKIYSPKQLLASMGWKYYY